MLWAVFKLVKKSLFLLFSLSLSLTLSLAASALGFRCLEIDWYYNTYQDEV